MLRAHLERVSTMAYNAAEIMSAVGTLAAGGAAVYVAIVGMRQYRDSVRLRAAATLAEIEKEFREIFGTLVHIEDDGGFEKFDAALKKDVTNVRLTEDELGLIAKLELVLRFFYLYRVRRPWLPELSEMDYVYQYYFSMLQHRDSVRQFAEKYYPRLLDAKARFLP